MSETPKIRILQDIRPNNHGSGEALLTYSGIAASVAEYRATHTQRANDVWDSEPGSIEELVNARQLALEYLLRTSEKLLLSNVDTRDVWADRFTLASSEIYGEPDEELALQLVAKEHKSLSNDANTAGVYSPLRKYLLDFYQPIVAAHPEITVGEITDQEREEAKAIGVYGSAIRDKYQPLFDIVDASGKGALTAQDMYDLFENALTWLWQNDDPDWKRWTLVKRKGTFISVDPVRLEIYMPTERQTATRDKAKGLLAHELLVHALRAKNGYQTGDRQLAVGLPFSTHTEEGLGLISEIAISGDKEDFGNDRYLTIALALGKLDGKQRTRRELFGFYYAYSLLEAQQKGEDLTTLASTRARTWNAIDRIYRGGPGDTIGRHQAVFTKDIAYYAGYRTMIAYITAELASGKPVSEIHTYLSSGKFDPTNPKDVTRRAQAKS